MAELPKYHETFIPILKVLSGGQSLRSRVLAESVRDNFYGKLSDNLLAKKTKSGTNVLIDRINWGKSYLKMANFVFYPERGKVQITQKGEQVLKKGVLSLSDLQNDKDFIAHRESVNRKKEREETLEVDNIETASPQDLIDSGFSSIEEEVKAELLGRLKEIDPYYFEKVILILLKKMGYGDFIRSEEHTSELQSRFDL